MFHARPLARIIATAAALALLLSTPMLAHASTFQIGWGNTPITAHGWSASPSGPSCEYRSPGTTIANPGQYGTNGGCWWRFHAPGASTVADDIQVSGGVSLANAAFRMRAYSDAASGGSVLAPSSRAFNSLMVPARGAHVVSIGLDQETGAAVTISTPEANNVRLDQGIVTLDDPSAPALQLGRSGSGTVTAATLTVSLEANDAESSIGRAQFTVDGGPQAGAGIADGCADVFVCGAERGASFEVATASLADGMHTVAVTVWNGAGMATTSFLGFMVDRSAPRAASVVVDPDPASFSPTYYHGHGPIIVHVVDQSTEGGGSGGVTFAQIEGWSEGWSWSTSSPGPFEGAIGIPVSGMRTGVYGLHAIESDSAHTTTGPNVYFDWDAAPPPGVQSVELSSWINAAEAATGAHLQWPELTGPAPWSGIAGAYIYASTAGGDLEFDARWAAANAVSTVTRGVPGATITNVPQSVIHGHQKVCLGIVPVSMTGVRQAPVTGTDIGLVCERIDEDAPTLNVAGDVGGAWRTTPASLNASATDVGASGLASIATSVDGEPVARDSNGSFSVTGEGVHTIGAAATDVAGNTTSSTITVRIDATPPTISLAGVPDAWVHGAVRVAARGSDAVSGIATLTATIDGTPVSIDDDGGLVVAGDGAHRLEVRAEDRAHNVTTRVETVRIDSVAPTARIDARAGWSSTPQTVHVTLEDRAAAGIVPSGIAEHRIRLDGQPAIVDTDGGVAVTTDGIHTVEASASDAAGNDSPIATAVVMIDTVAPVRAGDLSVDYAARVLSLPLIDAGSGVVDATLSADGTRLATSLSRAASGGSVVASAVVPSSLRLAGARITVVARDGAAPTPNVYDSSSMIGGPITVPPPTDTGGAKVTVCGDGTTRIVPASCPDSTDAAATPAGTSAGSTAREAGPGFSVNARAGSIVLARAPRRVAAGSRIVVTGRLVASSDIAHQPVVLRQRNAAWPSFARSWSTRTDASGAFRFRVTASMTGDLTVRFPGSSTVSPSEALAARIVLVPRIAARFTSPREARDAYGILRFYDVDVSGRFAPARGPKVTLLWQARTLRSGRFVSICPDVHVRANGTFHAHCKASPLPLETQYRLVYRGVNHAPYATLHSAPARARLAHRGGAMR